MSQFWAGLGLAAVLAVIAFGIWAFRKGAANAEGNREKADNELRNRARDARHDLDDAERKRLFDKYGK